MTLSLDLSDPQALELFPLIFAYNYFSTSLARAVRAGDVADVADVATLHGQHETLRRELERRGVMGTFIKLKRLEVQELLERAEGEPDERSLN